MFRSFRRPQAVRLAVVLLLATFASAACSSNNTAITAPTPTTISEVFTGTLTPNGGATWPFVAQTSGTVTATLTTLSPDSALQVGLALGTWNGSICQMLLTNDKATQGTVVAGTVSTSGTSGTLCVRIYDASGTLTAPESYQVNVDHP